MGNKHFSETYLLNLAKGEKKLFVCDMMNFY